MSQQQPTEEILAQELDALLTKQGRTTDERNLVYKAFEYAREKHEGQFRKNGEKYIVHPVHVAILLAGIPVDTATVAAALMHDVLEDTDATPEAMQQLFGPEIVQLVEGVTKLGKFQFESKQERTAENFRKMFLAMADDVRVIMLKLGDRLHNMQTLEFMTPEKQQRIATETLEVFAPLANRMGMGKWRAELEDLSFMYADPAEYHELVNMVEGSQSEWHQSVQEMQNIIENALQSSNMSIKIYGRVKNYFSIYRKLRQHQKNISDIYDLGALRIIVESEKDCYEALGAVHSHFKPIPGRFKDYIAMPKSNLYRSLHTTVISPTGRPIEVQIRTEEMHRIAEYGIAAHWKYKESGESVSAESAEEQKLSWLKQMLELKDEASDAQEYMDNIKLDLFRDEVFVFTPRGDVFDLIQGATPVDFAYRIHTHVGNTCTGALVNGKIVTLDHPLRNGDIVEILTSKKASPKLDWIKFVQTSHARTCIRQWFKKNFREDHIQQGKTLLEAELTRAVVDDALKNGKLLEVCQQLNFTKIDDMYMALGYGELTLPKIVNKLRKNPEKEREHKAESVLETIANNSNVYQRRKPPARDEIEGLQGMLYHLAKCCGPLPGDNVVGVVTRSRGVMVHRDDCINLSHVNPDRKMDVRWNAEVVKDKKKTLHSIRVDVHVIDRVGIFKDVLARIADTNTNVSNARVKTIANNTALIEITVDINDLDHLEKVIRVVSKLSDVISVSRAQVRPLKQKSNE